MHDLEKACPQVVSMLHFTQKLVSTLCEIISLQVIAVRTNSFEKGSFLVKGCVNSFLLLRRIRVVLNDLISGFRIMIYGCALFKKKCKFI